MIVLFLELLKKYDEILPPTILKKKRESERKVPVRRRTRPVDMRMSRSRISAGADLKELHAQQLAQRGIKVSKSPPPPVPRVLAPSPPGGNLDQLPESPRNFTEEPEGMDGHEALTAEPEEFSIPPPPGPEPGDISLNDKRAATLDYSKVPPPPPLPRNIPPPPALPTQPARPTFKEPPPETDEVPSRPQFKEPPPEPESPPPIPRPAHFVEPSLDDEPPAASSPPPAAPVPIRRIGIPRVSSPPTSSRSPSPTKTATPPASTPTSSTAGDRLRGPRLTRGPRAAGAGVSPYRQSLVRPNSPGSPPGSGNGFPNGGGGANLKRAGSRTSTAGKRSSISRVSELSRRTMASDAEDEVLQ